MMLSEPKRMAIEPPNKLSIKVQNDAIVFFSKEKDDRVEVKFHRTIRIPEDDKTYPLPSSMGILTVEKIDDYITTVPEKWRQTGGVFICLQQREALRMEFINTNQSYPHAFKVASGMINVLSGDEWDEKIKERHVQDYIVTPVQNRLDGMNCGVRKVKQFVAMPLGTGYTVEDQISHHEEAIGGIQLICYNSKSHKREDKFGKPSKPITPKKPNVKPTTPQTLTKPTNYPPMMKAGLVQKKTVCSPPSSNESKSIAKPMSTLTPTSSSSPNRRIKSSRETSNPEEMGIATSGTLKQTIIADPYTDFWDEDTKARVFVHIVNSSMYTQITGRKAPISPITQELCQKLNYPWFEHFVEESGSINPSETLSRVTTVKEKDIVETGKSIDTSLSIKVGKTVKTIGKMEKADVTFQSIQTKPHPFRDILPKELVFLIGTYLTVPPLNRLARCDRYLLHLFFNLTVPKVYAITKRKDELKKQGMDVMMVSVKDQYQDDEESPAQHLLWKPMVLFYFPNYSQSLNIKNWMHVLRRRVVHLMQKSPSSLPLTKKRVTDPYSISNVRPGKDRLFIENCEWEYECPLKSIDFKLVSKGVKYCSVCKEKVFEVYTEEEFHSHVQQGHCVSLSPLLREPVLQVRGRVAPPPIAQ